MQSKIYKALLRIFVHKVEMSHLVIIMASFVLFYRLLLLCGHIQNINKDDVSLISQANAASDNSESETFRKAEEIKNISSPSTPPIQAEKNQSSEEEKNEEFDPLFIDENQVKILNALSTQKEKLPQTDDSIKHEKEKELLRLAHENLSKKLAELEKNQKSFDTKKSQLTTQEKTQVQTTAKMYETMKPARSAEILNQLELTAVTEIIRHMNPKKASEVLAAMEVGKARKVTFELLRTRDSLEGTHGDLEISS